MQASIPVKRLASPDVPRDGRKTIGAKRQQSSTKEEEEEGEEADREESRPYFSIVLRFIRPPTTAESCSPINLKCKPGGEIQPFDGRFL